MSYQKFQSTRLVSETNIQLIKNFNPLALEQDILQIYYILCCTTCQSTRTKISPKIEMHDYFLNGKSNRPAYIHLSLLRNKESWTLCMPRHDCLTSILYM